MSEFRRVLEDRLEGLSAPDRRAEFLGLLQTYLSEEPEAVLVGGGLVELLTEGQFVTGGLNLVGDRYAIQSLLDQAGFEQSGRHLFDEDLGITVEVVDRHLDPSTRTERIRWRDHTLTVVSLEDLIVDRLCAAKFWDSPTDHEQARLLYATHGDRVDQEHLRSRAREEQVEDLLAELASTLEDRG